MNDVPTWLWPLLSMLGAAVGSWGAIKITVAKLEVHVSGLLSEIKLHDRQIAKHNEDLLVHDLELDTALAKLELPRVKRQPLRGWDD